MNQIVSTLFLAAGLSLFQPGLAAAGKLQISGQTLIYDTNTPGDGEVEGIEYDDVDRMLDMLRANEGLTTLQLNSTGGKVWAAQEISDMIIDFELDTHVHGDCESACATVFLAGTRRTMSRGSRLGFHRFSWSADAIEDYYLRERDDNEWETPFDFAEWMYEDTQNEVYDYLRYIIERGVSAEFAIEVISETNDGLWRPKRRQLVAAGVLTE